MRPVIHSCIHSFIYLFTHSLIHSLVPLVIVDVARVLCVGRSFSSYCAFRVGKSTKMGKKGNILFNFSKAGLEDGFEFIYGYR